eukprot:115563-Amphidinium_carterae.1
MLAVRLKFQSSTITGSCRTVPTRISRDCSRTWGFCRRDGGTLEIVRLITLVTVFSGVLCDANGVVRALFAAYDLEEATEAAPCHVKCLLPSLNETHDNTQQILSQ